MEERCIPDNDQRETYNAEGQRHWRCTQCHGQRVLEQKVGSDKEAEETNGASRP